MMDLYYAAIQGQQHNFVSVTAMQQIMAIQTNLEQTDCIEGREWEERIRGKETRMCLHTE